MEDPRYKKKIHRDATMSQRIGLWGREGALAVLCIEPDWRWRRTRNVSATQFCLNRRTRYNVMVIIIFTKRWSDIAKYDNCHFLRAQNNYFNLITTVHLSFALPEEVTKAIF